MQEAFYTVLLFCLASTHERGKNRSNKNRETVSFFLCSLKPLYCVSFICNKAYSAGVGNALAAIKRKSQQLVSIVGANCRSSSRTRRGMSSLISVEHARKGTSLPAAPYP